MRDAGWDEDVAADAMETTLQEHLNELAVQRANPVRCLPVPEPLLGDSPALLNAGDRRVQVLMQLAKPAWWCLATSSRRGMRCPDCRRRARAWPVRSPWPKTGGEG